MEREASALPISVTSISSESLGCEKADRVTEADSCLTSKTGSKLVLKPVAPLCPVPIMLRTAFAESGIVLLRPKSTVPVPWKEMLAPTSYDKIAPSFKKWGISNPASGTGKEKSSFENCRESGLLLAVMTASSSSSAAKPEGAASMVKALIVAISTSK